MGPIFRRYGLTVYFSACFDSPTLLANLSSDPLASEAQAWWRSKASEVYSLLPGFGGWLVKADSEGNGGPIVYNRTEADGANLLARAVAPYGGIVMWRAFVYANGQGISPGPTAPPFGRKRPMPLAVLSFVCSRFKARRPFESFVFVLA